MFGELTAALGSAKALADIIGAGKGVIDQAKAASALFDLNSKLLDTQGVMMTLQNENADLQQRVRALEAAIAERSDWKTEAAKFDLRQVASGVFAYIASDSTIRDPSGTAKYCCACFHDRKLALLQQGSADLGRQISLECPNHHPPLVFPDYLQPYTARP